MNLDYARTENVQFEDDEYYYYVKAVPKKMIAKEEKVVKSTLAIQEALERRFRDIIRKISAKRLLQKISK